MLADGVRAFVQVVADGGGEGGEIGFGFGSVCIVAIIRAQVLYESIGSHVRKMSVGLDAVATVVSFALDLQVSPGVGFSAINYILFSRAVGKGHDHEVIYLATRPAEIVQALGPVGGEGDRLTFEGDDTGVYEYDGQPVAALRVRPFASREITRALAVQ